MKNLKTKILDAVQKNSVTMIPKWKFLLYSALGLVGVAFTFLSGVFIVSLILFVLSRYGFMYMPFFGLSHIWRTLSVVPPLLFICTVLLIILIEILSRRYEFSFKRPLFVTLLSSTLLVLVVGFIISETSAHEYVKTFAHDHRISMMERVYDRPEPFKRGSGMDVVRGEVVMSSPTSTTLKLFNDDVVTVYMSASSTIPKPLTIGDDVVVVGTFSGDHFMVTDVRLAKGMHFGGHMGGRKMMNQNVGRFGPMMK